MLLPDKKSINQNINLEQWSDKGLLVEMKREDLLHPEISGNKYRKLKYNLKETEKIFLLIQRGLRFR